MKMNIFDFVKSNLNADQKRWIKRNYECVASIFVSNNLIQLAKVFGTDKWNAHWYAQHYQSHFQSLRHKKLKILEIGVGGDTDPKSGGASLRMWKKYFPNSHIYSIDIHDKSALQENRIKIFHGSQADEGLLADIHNQVGPFDIIIDDGSHLNEHVLQTFKYLFPLLRVGGIYAAEDIQTSYWPNYGGDSINLNNPKTSIGFFKSLVDSLNHVEFDKISYQPNYYDRNIVAMHFYHNLVFIYKGNNDEKTYGTR